MVNILLMLVSFAPSILAKCNRCVEASTTAMFMGTPISFAFFSAAAIAILAPDSVSCSCVRVAILTATLLEERLMSL